MSKKRKRHQDDDETAIFNEKSSPPPEQESSGTEQAVSFTVLDAKGLTFVQKKVFHGVKEIGRAFKKARDFEVRKIIKRSKSAKDAKNSERVARLEVELRIAKALDVHPFAEAYFRKQLQCLQPIVDNPQLLEGYAVPAVELPPKEEEEITKNLVGRMSSAVTVKTTMATAIDAILRAASLNVTDDDPPSTTEKVKHQIKEERRAKSYSTPPSSPSLTLPARSPSFIRSDAPVPESDLGYEETDMERDESTESRSPSVTPKPPRKAVILPALSSGYIPADDGSDPDEEYASFAALKPPRKNRMGQRARRAVWLKKYGSNARHLREEVQGKTQKKLKKREEKKEEGEKVEVSAVPETVKKVRDSHPSWVAKQKQREEQKLAMTSVKPQKIIFD